MIYFILPAYNEEKNIKILINNIFNFYKQKKIPFHIVVINDGSTDQTLKNIKSVKKIRTLTLLNHNRNLGLGKTLKTGFNWTLKNAKLNDIIISMDSDNSHTPKNSYLLIKKINDGYDVVVASRYNSLSRTYGLNYLRKILSFVSCIIFKIFFPIKNISDYTCGFRAFRINKIKDIMLKKNFFSEEGFTVSADILLKLKLSKIQLSYAEIPLILRYDLKQGQSKMKVIKTIFQTLKLIIMRRFFYLTIVKL
jgi:dolichol-phosphate mannosyltransferase